ncbi:MAG TPA: hypothetical protein DCR93_39670, partial [Cytophagales bacterium]|nr:hypothetical protein [Cytophagales bacterium]
MLFSHHIRMAGRTLRRNPRTTLVNVVGLTVGISAFLAISQILLVEYSYNRGIPEGDRVYRITSNFSGAFTAKNGGIPRPTGLYIQEQFTGLETIAQLHTEFLRVARPSDVPFANFDRLEDQNWSVWTDAAYFELFPDYTWLAGNPRTALEDPYQVVLTEAQAQAYFGTQPPATLLNETLLYSDTLTFTITGIVQPPPYRTDLHFTEFLSFSTFQAIPQYREGFDEVNWGSTSSSSQTWLKLKEGYPLASLNVQLDSLFEVAVGFTEDPGFTQHFEAQSLADIHFSTEYGIFSGSRPTANRQSLLVMASVALALLLIAIFNFVNLETAQSVNKSKEVGVRKVLGGHRSDLMGRFLTDSLLVTGIAVIISVPLAALGLQYFEEFLPEPVSLPYQSPYFWGFLIALLLVVGIMAGAYPTWVVASFQPIKALKNRYNTAGSSGGSARLRRLLIGFQFAFSQLLIVGTLAVVFQLDFLMSKDLGLDKEGIVHLYTPWQGAVQDRDRLLNTLQKESLVQDVSIQRFALIQRGWNTQVVEYQQGEEIQDLSVNTNGGDTTFLSFYNLPLSAGRMYASSEQSQEVVINETMAQNLGFELAADALGFPLDFGDDDVWTVVGIMPDIHFQSLHKNIEPMMLNYTPEGRALAMRVPLDDRMETAMDMLEGHWSEVYPENSFNPVFMDETVRRFYQNERQMSTLASVATVIAVLISCLGLFGLISFSVVQRSKEMGIRKVLGASIANISQLLSREFLLLIGLSFLVATPLAYWFISQWMADFAFQLSIGWWVYGLGGILSATVALVTISAKVWQASRTNP